MAEVPCHVGFQALLIFAKRPEDLQVIQLSSCICVASPGATSAAMRFIERAMHSGWMSTEHR